MWDRDEAIVAGLRGGFSHIDDIDDATIAAQMRPEVRVNSLTSRRVRETRWCGERLVFAEGLKTVPRRWQVLANQEEAAGET